jgi:hypothetical protein
VAEIVAVSAQDSLRGDLGIAARNLCLLNSGITRAYCTLDAWHIGAAQKLGSLETMQSSFPTPLAPHEAS